jgi:hypothetical protein
LSGVAARRLLAAVMDGVQCDAAVILAPHRVRTQAALARSGFVPAPRIGPILTVRPLAALAADPLQRSAWRLSVGDLELF